MTSASIGILAFLVMAATAVAGADETGIRTPSRASNGAEVAERATQDMSFDDPSPREATGAPKRLSPLAGTDAEAWASVPRWSHPRPAARPKPRRSGP
jgi:hypothetical protein